MAGQWSTLVLMKGKSVLPDKSTCPLCNMHVCACAHIICMARYAVGLGEVPPNLNLPILLFGPLRTKPPNLKTTNISGYTVLGGMWQLLTKGARYTYLCRFKNGRFWTKQPPYLCHFHWRSFDVKIPHTTRLIDTSKHFKFNPLILWG